MFHINMYLNMKETLIDTIRAVLFPPRRLLCGAVFMQVYGEALRLPQARIRQGYSRLRSDTMNPEMTDFRRPRVVFSYPSPDRLRGSPRPRTAQHHPPTLP